MKIILILIYVILNIIFEFSITLKFARNIPDVNLNLGSSILEENNQDEFVKSILRAKKIDGHMEKIERDSYEYVYVSGNEPSGLPDSMVVSDEEALKSINNPEKN